MCLPCSLLLPASGTTFSLPFVNLSLVPEAASSLLLPRLIGRQRAAKHLLLGDSFDAETALEYGLVTGIVPAEELGRQLCALSERLAAKPPEAHRLKKALMLPPDCSVAGRRASQAIGDDPCRESACQPE